MTVNEAIIAALEHFKAPVVPNMYTGEETTYYTFNYDITPAGFGNNAPSWWRALIQVHFFCPLSVNSIKQRQETAAALVRGGFGWPSIVDASDKDMQHFVFETEILTDERTETQ